MYESSSVCICILRESELRSQTQAFAEDTLKMLTRAVNGHLVVAPHAIKKEEKTATGTVPQQVWVP